MSKRQTYMRTKEGTVWATTHPEYHNDCERLPQAEGKRLRAEYCQAELRTLLKPGDTVYCLVRSVAKSGMSRKISCYITAGTGIRNIDVLVADAIDWRYTDAGIYVGGCGMDMGFHLVYTLGRCLWPGGTPEAHGSRNGAPDKDGGYALKKEWM